MKFLFKKLIVIKLKIKNNKKPKLNSNYGNTQNHCFTLLFIIGLPARFGQKWSTLKSNFF